LEVGIIIIILDKGQRPLGPFIWKIKRLIEEIHGIQFCATSKEKEVGSREKRLSGFFKRKDKKITLV
jgi:hypothetical protein